MRKPKPHGPYSAEELSNMDDAELGRLYREKNRFKETVWPLWLPFLFALGALCGLVPSMIMGIIYHFRFAWLIFCILCYGSSNLVSSEHTNQEKKTS